jgi:putative redox protein
MTETSPPLVAELVWSHERRFDVRSGPIAFPIDGDTVEGPSPMQLLAVGLAGCMSIDIVDIIRKGRHPISSLATTITGQRLSTPPRRFVSFHLHCRMTGNVPEGVVTRAFELSRAKYCSVWHSLREDITLTTSFDVQS